MNGAPDTKIALSRVHFPVTALGPGRRIGIWFQGCSLQCPGCISVDTWAVRDPVTAVSDLLETMGPWLDQADGITITGGEPFEQPEGLRWLLSSIRQRAPIDILVFTGYRLEDIGQWVSSMQGLIDALLAGPYQSESGQTKALRGSDNQQLHLLTALGRRMFGELETQGPSNRLDMMMSRHGDVYFAGIPSPGDFSALQELLKQAGHMVSISVDRRPA